MKRTVGLSFSVLIVVALFALSSSVVAFHDAATIKCMACHTMHASENGAPANITNANGFDAADGSLTGAVPHLLVRANKTDLCLACHSTNYPIGGQNAPDVYGATQALPGGDFNFSSATYDDANGHNPYHLASGTIIQDGVFATDLPPGESTNTLWEWSCLSCHRPHKDTSATTPATATYAYRLLRKHIKGPGAVNTYVDVSGALVGTDALKANIVAAGANIAAETAGNHNVYQVPVAGDAGDGFGAWCAACHGNFHGAANEKSGLDWIRHPTYQPLGAVIGPNYTATYDPSVPAEVNAAASLTISTTALTAQNTNAQVGCLSCHRAHAGGGLDPDDGVTVIGYANITRWDNTYASGAGTNCNKCHKKGS